MKKVLYITNLPAPYKIDFFYNLGKEVDLTVAFERNNAVDRNENWISSDFKGFKHIFMKGKEVGTDGAICPEICNFIKNGNFDEIVASTYSTPTGMIAIQYMKNHNIPYYISSDGGFKKSDNFIKYNIKHHFLAGAKGYFSSGKTTDEYLINYGADKDKIYRYPFTSLNEIEVLDTIINDDQKKLLRSDLGMPESKIIVGVGQFIPRKGWDTLLKAAVKLPRDVGIYIIGGVPDNKFVEYKIAHKLDNVHFIDFKVKSELAKYYCAADIFVLPTREDIWGLVVNEAMGYGLPVITTEKCIAGLEMVQNGKNGFIVPVGDYKELLGKINILLNDSELCKNMGVESLKVAKEYTIEKMAEAYLKVLK